MQLSACASKVVGTKIQLMPRYSVDAANPVMSWTIPPPIEIIVMAQTSVFTYQGRLTFQGYSANGNYDLTFKLFDALANGNQLGSTITSSGSRWENWVSR